MPAERKMTGHTDIYTDFLKRRVERGGGVFVGIQETEDATYNLVLFNSPTTGSTLALEDYNCDPERIRIRIADSDAKFRAGGK